MPSTSRAHREGATEDRSAGRRRNPRSGIYDRPSPATAPTPNWLTGVVLPKIATGAATLFSSFISCPEDSYSSSDSSENDDTPDASPADGGDENTYSPFFIDGVDMLNKENASTPEFDKCTRKESLLTIGKSETKHLIEKLIMQETFSREEGDSLMGIINSRVIDVSDKNEGLVTRSDIPDFCNKAIIEAKQWIEGKKESNSKLQLLQDTEGELGSPVDMAKAYMRARPPWSSPILNSVEEKTQPQSGIDDLKDEAPHGISFSSLKRKLSRGSWSIQDEIRRVRSKATEDMLKTLPSQINNASSFLLEPEGIGNTLLNGSIDLGSGDRLRDSILSTVAGVGTSGCLPDSVVDTTQNNKQTEDLLLQPVTAAQIQCVGNIQIVEGDKHAADGSGPSAIPDPVSENGLRFTDKSCSITDGEFILAGSREVENNHQPSDDKNTNAVYSKSVEIPAGHVGREEISELLSETSVEIPSMDNVEEITIDNSLSNSIKHTEELSKKVTRPKNLKRVAKGKTTKVGAGQGRKLRPKTRAT